MRIQNETIGDFVEVMATTIQTRRWLDKRMPDYRQARLETLGYLRRICRQYNVEPQPFIDIYDGTVK